jgi:hypothetical protein
MISRHGNTINWVDLKMRMENGGLGRVFDARMYQLSALLELPLPTRLTKPTRAKIHHRRCLWQLRWPWLIDLAMFWAGMTQPFKQHAMDLIYGCGSNPIKVNAYRLRHAGIMLWKYRGQLRRKMAEKKAMYEQ